MGAPTFFNPDYSIDIYRDLDQAIKPGTEGLFANTWESWRLVPTERPSIAPPEVKTEYVEIPGANGALDYTEVLAGDVRYGNRTGSWEFIVADANSLITWHNTYDQLLKLLHGRRFYLSLREKPNYIYVGRLTLNQWKSEERYSKITIDYNLEPYYKLKTGATTDWLWDDLTFTTDAYIIYYGSFIVNGSLIRNLYNPTDHEVEVSLTVSDSMRAVMRTREYPGDGYPYYAGTYEHSGIFLAPYTSDVNGNNIITFIGNGEVTINYDKETANI